MFQPQQPPKTRVTGSGLRAGTPAAGPRRAWRRSNGGSGVGLCKGGSIAKAEAAALAFFGESKLCSGLGQARTADRESGGSCGLCKGGGCGLCNGESCGLWKGESCSPLERRKLRPLERRKLRPLQGRKLQPFAKAAAAASAKAEAAASAKAEATAIALYCEGQASREQGGRRPLPSNRRRPRLLERQGRQPCLRETRRTARGRTKTPPPGY